MLSVSHKDILLKMSFFASLSVRQYLEIYLTDSENHWVIPSLLPRKLDKYLIKPFNNHCATATCVAIAVCHKQVNLRCVHSYSYRCSTSTQSLTTTESKINENEMTNKCNNSNWKLMLPQGVVVMPRRGRCTRRWNEMKMLRKCAQCAQCARAFKSESVQWKYKSTQVTTTKTAPLWCIA